MVSVQVLRALLKLILLSGLDFKNGVLISKGIKNDNLKNFVSLFKEP